MNNNDKVAKNTLLISCFLHTFQFSLLACTIPLTVLNLYGNDDNAPSKASYTIAIQQTLANVLLLFTNQFAGVLSDSIGRRNLLLTCISKKKFI